MSLFKLTICASGGGGNFQALIDARKEFGFEINCLIVDRDCKAILRAHSANIPVKILSKFSNNFSANFLKLIPIDTDLIVLAGFMSIVPKEVCDFWFKKIINTHPSLLPNFGGRGMYGVKVQEAVISSGQKFAGCTIHYVTEEIDAGDIILQKSVKIKHKETPWELGGRIFTEENKLLVEAVRLLSLRKDSNL